MAGVAASPRRRLVVGPGDRSLAEGDLQSVVVVEISTYERPDVFRESLEKEALRLARFLGLELESKIGMAR